MDEMNNFHSTSTNYYTTSPENHLLNSTMDNLILHSSIDHYWPFCGSIDFSSVTAASDVTDSASIETTTTPNHQIILPIRGRLDQDDDDASGDAIKEKIVSHPSYSKLLHAYIDCQKVGAPPDVAYLLDDIRHENINVSRRNYASASTCFGVDPELDDFMETFCNLLVKYKSDLTRPFDEATVFLTNIETQLHNLAIGA
ncbi:hypothetical protein M8C21_032051 [Ambrosia artemisiifolia]|uniref:Uncharacterized protein n=1 Tax=Ambrosia artemisiifolia TaxID=4212 RepID=A0AAD5C5S4_AMBAR|nr:hypothetical protein M8C21_032051 [Ambrosia artemisiifolia]